MFKFEKLQTLFNCKLCSELLREPVLLPCGVSICKFHSSEITGVKCEFCKKPHTLPESGFAENKLVQSMLDIQLNILNINLFQFTDCKNSIRDLKVNFKEFASFKSSLKKLSLSAELSD